MSGIPPIDNGGNVDATSGKTSTAHLSDEFMQLLMTQLKQQDPMSPMDSSQMVSELTQFNILDQVTQIRQLLQSVEADQ